MAVGDVTTTARNRRIQVTHQATAKAAPSGATGGVSMDALCGPRRPREAAIFLCSTAGSGTMTVTVRCWGYNSTAAQWSPCGVGSSTLKGLLNNQNAIPEISADFIAHFEPLDLPTTMDRFDVEFTAIGGTATAISTWLIIPEEP